MHIYIYMYLSLTFLCRWMRDTSKIKLAGFFFFCASPSCFPGFTRDWPDDWSKQVLKKKSGWLKILAGFTRKKASTRRVNRKIADFTRNPRVFFSMYLGANYGWSVPLRSFPASCSRSRWSLVLLYIYR